ncbi:hypothetical protein Anas_09808 [Armadillidium nasatum]|uniref:Uncharacterized protein n=1 Tax=Armadillidium nasatum TaxID=96803 RepID=A0A5N5T9M1_9CRUS|nr:hypothetical protein Anas_09808 [Armadillidium nasatum]
MPGDSNFLHRVKVTEHLKCECQCKETSSDCTPAQKYHPHICKCLCPEETKKHCEKWKGLV